MVLDKLDQRGREAVLCGGGRELEFPIRIVQVATREVVAFVREHKS